MLMTPPNLSPPGGGDSYFHGHDKAQHPILWADWAKAVGSIPAASWTAEAVELKVKAAVYLVEQALSKLPAGVHRLTVLINVTDVRVDQVGVKGGL